ncbi:Uncharacterized protein CG3556 [Araneus ventricosus]|uniref:Uncharacterized protein CG3556 n=1 Tax=Araneus ventricosus TaxID=182803 RepID=A0A4Y2NFB8_ARAVE|nr:Uncharacterized protein CG3556 [Araneus ventricosus]
MLISNEAFELKSFFTATVCCVTCTRVTGISGTITNEKTASTYAKCWSISVPQNSNVLIDMDSFTTTVGRYESRYCSDTKVEISLDNKDETFIFCPNRSNWESLVLKEDFTLTHYIKSSYNILQSEFSLKYQKNLPCSDESDVECDDNGICTWVSKKCDVTEQCSEGADKDCGNKTLIVPDLFESRVNGIRRLKNKWSYSTGWQENTHRGITALFLAREGNEKKANLEEKLMVKQLEVQTLVYLLRKETGALTVNQLSMLVNALTVSCQNPRNFFGHDLVKLLRDEVEASSTITHSVAYLALCNAGETLPVNVTDDLSKSLKTNAEYSFLLDVQAITVMALSCLKVSYENGLNASFPQTDYEEAVRKFKELQLGDGSFGNIYTTAVVTQALLSAGQESTKDWNYNKAISYLIHHLNSASNDFLAVYLILPILNGKCLSHIRNTNCSAIAQRDAVADVKNKLGSKMRVQYSLYIGDEKDIVHTISLRVPENITVFEVMQLAQDADAKYKFQGKQMGEKLYIYDIAGITNDFEDGKFWLLYVGKDAESMRHTNEIDPHRLHWPDFVVAISKARNSSTKKRLIPLALVSVLSLTHVITVPVPPRGCCGVRGKHGLLVLLQRHGPGLVFGPGGHETTTQT